MECNPGGSILAGKTTPITKVFWHILDLNLQCIRTCFITMQRALTIINIHKILDCWRMWLCSSNSVWLLLGPQDCQSSTSAASSTVKWVGRGQQEILQIFNRSIDNREYRSLFDADNGRGRKSLAVSRRLGFWSYSLGFDVLLQPCIWNEHVGGEPPVCQTYNKYWSSVDGEA